MEIGTITPTKIDKAKVTLKDPKPPFPLFTLFLPFYSVLTLTVLIGFTSFRDYFKKAFYFLQKQIEDCHGIHLISLSHSFQTH
jgi:hypothetical protein